MRLRVIPLPAFFIKFLMHFFYSEGVLVLLLHYFHIIMVIMGKSCQHLMKIMFPILFWRYSCNEDFPTNTPLFFCFFDFVLFLHGGFLARTIQSVSKKDSQDQRKIKVLLMVEQAWDSVIIVLNYFREKCQFLLPYI